MIFTQKSTAYRLRRDEMLAIIIPVALGAVVFIVFKVMISRGSL